MQIATVQLALGGDKGNTVHKYAVTPAEVAVLRHIHGDDAVTDIHPHGTIDRANRAERQRLAEVYGRRDDKGRPVAPAVEALFPGAATRVFERFDELDLPEDFFKAASRVSAGATPATAPAGPAEAVNLAAMTAKQLVAYAAGNGIDLGEATKKGDVLAAIKAAEAKAEQPEAGDDADEDDGIGEMDDAGRGNLFQ